MKRFQCFGLLVLTATLANRVYAEDTPPTTDSGLEEGALVQFYSPAEDRPAFGDLTISVDVLAEDVIEVEFHVDGEEVGRLRERPYRLPIDLGEDFGAHRFEVVVRRREGQELRAVRRTPGLHIDEVIDLELQQLYVSLPDGSPETDLVVADFEVLDDGQRQTIVTFERGDAPLTVALLIDGSESMRGGRLKAALEGARAFMRGMRSLDEATVVLFSDSIRYRSPFSQEPDELADAVSAVEAGGGTALNDTLYVSMKQLEARQGRRVVVLLSDGVDIHSVLSVSDLEWSIHRSRSIVYWIELQEESVATGALSPWRNSEQHAEEREGLRRLVRESGGRVVSIESEEQAAAAFGDILDELRQQYVLGYYPGANLGDGRWHPVEVRVRRPRVKVHTRGGYVDY